MIPSHAQPGTPPRSASSARRTSAQMSSALRPIAPAQAAASTDRARRPPAGVPAVA